MVFERFELYKLACHRQKQKSHMSLSKNDWLQKCMFSGILVICKTCICIYAEEIEKD